MTDSETEFEVIYMKVLVNGKELIEIDKYNFIAKFDGKDQLASVRKVLCLA